MRLVERQLLDYPKIYLLSRVLKYGILVPIKFALE